MAVVIRNFKSYCLGFLFVLGLFSCSQKSYYAVIPVKFQGADLPYVEVIIEGDHYPVVIDLGSRLEIDMHEDVLAKLDKRSFCIEKWKNVRGKEFAYRTYRLPKIEIGSLLFKDPIVVGVPIEKREDYLLWRDPDQEKTSPETVGSLGRSLLKKVNLLLDMRRSRIIAASSLSKLKDDGYDLAFFVKVPFRLIPKGMIVNVETDLGRLNLLLDTGFTLTMLNKALYPKNGEERKDFRGFPTLKTNKFSMKGIDFGSKDLYFLDMEEDLRDIDGFLGMDFIRSHVMYIDFSKQMIYIQPCS